MTHGIGLQFLNEVCVLPTIHSVHGVPLAHTATAHFNFVHQCFSILKARAYNCGKIYCKTSDTNCTCIALFCYSSCLKLLLKLAHNL